MCEMKEAKANALEMDSWYQKTGYEGYKTERDAWLKVAKKRKEKCQKCKVKHLCDELERMGFPEGCKEEENEQGTQEEH